MSETSIRVFSREFKLKVVRRMLAGENVSALAREVKVLRKDLYAWRDRFRSGGPDALRGPGRPRKTQAAVSAVTAKSTANPPPAAAAAKRIAELERKVGQQQVELDFFRQALRQIEAARRPSNGSGVTGSTPSSKR